LLFAWVLAASLEAQVINTVAGTSWSFPTSNLTALTAPLGQLGGVAVDSSGNVYAADYQTNIVARISPGGAFAIVAGNGNAGFSGDGGAAAGASLSLTYSYSFNGTQSARGGGIAVDSSGNLYIADTGNNRIRMVSGGTITTIAGNGSTVFSGDGAAATGASLSFPSGVALDTAGNIYIADAGHNRIRKVSGGTISTVAGNGPAGFAGDAGAAISGLLNAPQGVVVDGAGNIYIADTGNGRIRKVSSGVINTFLPSITAQGLAVDAAGNLYVADALNYRVIKASAGNSTTVAGNGVPGFSGDGGPATSASLGGISTVAMTVGPLGVAVDASNNLYVADTYNDRVRKVAGGTISTIAGNGGYQFSGDGGPATSAAFNNPRGLAVDAAGNIYIADPLNNRVRKVSHAGTITTFAGNGVHGFSGDGGPATSASLNGPTGVALDSLGNLYIADTMNNRVRLVSNGIITTVAGGGSIVGDGGPATSAQLNNPVGVSLDFESNLFIADASRVRKVSAGAITTVAGNGTVGYSGDNGPAPSASLNHPSATAIDQIGNVYIADQGNNLIRLVSAGMITTFAGGGTFIGDGGPAAAAKISSPSGLYLVSNHSLYIVDSGNNRIRLVTGSITTTISTVAGNGTAGFSGDGGPATSASLNNPGGITLDAAGNIYIADSGNNRVREVFAGFVAIPYQTTPLTLNFSGIAGGTVPGPQTVSLSSSIAGLSFTAASNAPWLSVNPVSASLPAVLEVSVDTTNLSVGTYQGTITFSVPNATPASSKVAVTLTVAPFVPPALGVSTQNVSFAATQNSAPLTQQLQISNTGGGSLPFTAVVSGASWLTLSATSGTATPSSPVSLTITATLGSLTPGTYSATVAIAAAGATINVLVTLSVSSPTASILMTQVGLTFLAVAQGGVPLPQQFGILNTGQGNMSWSATATTVTGASWLQISPASGTVARPLLDVSLVTVSINTSGLGAGTYYGQIQVSAPAVNTPQLLTVILTVLPVGSSLGPQLYPTGLIFTGIAGVTPGKQDVLVGNPTGLANSFQTGQIGSGFSFVPPNATIQPSQPTTVHVYPDFSKLTPGTISRGTITLQFSDGSPSQTVNILFVVAPPGSTVTANAKEDRWYHIDLSANAGSACASQNLQVQYRSPALGFTAVVGQATLLEAQVTDGCGNLVGPGGGQSATVTANFSDADPAQAMTHIGNGIWQAAWKPVNVGPVVVSVLALLPTGGVGATGGTAALSGTVNAPSQAAATPLVTAAGVVHAASDLSGVPIAPGGLITVYGNNLADGAAQDNGLPLPDMLSGTQVLLGNLNLPILYANTGQLNLQVPYGVPVNTQYQLTVQHGNTLSLPQSLVVAQAQPGIFTVNQQGTGQGSIVKSDGVTLVQPGTPATAGDTIVIYCTGLGAVSPPVMEGSPAPTTPPLSTTVNAVTVTIGGQPATVAFSGLAPGFAGLYQINVVVPSGVTPGNAVPVVLTVAGQTSPSVTIALQ